MFNDIISLVIRCRPLASSTKWSYIRLTNGTKQRSDYSAVRPTQRALLPYATQSLFLYFTPRGPDQSFMVLANVGLSSI
jgi:hypothetical protein